MPRFTTTITEMKPEDNVSRSPKVISPTSPVIMPSTNILPTGTAPDMAALPATRSTLTPFSANRIDSSGTPVLAASLAFARRCRQVPCTGMTWRGRTPLYRNSSSPAYAWPETCTRAWALVTTRAPILDSESMTP